GLGKYVVEEPGLAAQGAAVLEVGNGVSAGEGAALDGVEVRRRRDRDGSGGDGLAGGPRVHVEPGPLEVGELGGGRGGGGDLARGQDAGEERAGDLPHRDERDGGGDRDESDEIE